MTTDTPRDLPRLLKRYVLAHAEAECAQLLVNQHKKLLDRIKAIYIQHDLHEYAVQDEDVHATLEFRQVQSQRVDTASLPEDIRRRYTRPVTTRRAVLTIRRP
jgi:hypothetical protein